VYYKNAPHREGEIITERGGQMAKLATVKFKWTRSMTPVDFISRMELVTKVNGQESVYNVDRSVESFNLEIRARSVVSFKVVTYGDEETDVASSQEITFVLPDFESVQAVTNLGWEVVAVRDEEETPPAPTPTPEPEPEPVEAEVP
jgi:hypothetical protein